jgi:hypothetical protein
VLRCMSPVLAHGHSDSRNECPLSGVKRTCRGCSSNFGSDLVDALERGKG